MSAPTARGVQLAVGLGVGIGLMVSSGLVALMSKPAPTEAEVRTKAKALGMVELTQLPAAKAPAAPAQVVKTVYVLTVAEGMTSQDVAALLKGAGVIKEADAFVARAKERGLEGAIKPGTYTVTQEDPTTAPSLDQLIDIVTRNK